MMAAPVDKRLPRKLVAILYADVADYSRLTGEDEDSTHRTLRTYLDLIASIIEDHGGQVMHYAGDAVLAKFGAALNAVTSAQEFQDKLTTHNDSLSDERKVRFRIGINLGDVIEDRGDIYGDGVNVAARLESLAEPGGVCISDAVRVSIGNRLPVHAAFIGEHLVKNIEEPVRAYRLLGDDSALSASSPEAIGLVEVMQPFSKTSLAIKPFEYIGSDADQDHLADGMTNGLIASLMQVAGLTLIGDDSPSKVESKGMSAKELGRRFHVGYVLTGSVRRHGDRVRISAELLEMSSSKYVWAEKFDRDLQDFGDLFTIQDEIVDEIVTALDVKLLSGDAARLVRKALRNVEALSKYYRGENLLWRATTKPELREAKRNLEDVIRLEPESPVGYAIISLAYWIEIMFEMSDAPQESMERASELARRAIELGDVTGYAHMVLAHLYLGERKYRKAMEEANRAVSDRPSCPASYSLKASVLNFLGRPEEAIELARYAMGLTPDHPPMYPAILASAYFGAKRYRQAIAAAKATIELGSQSVDPYLIWIASSVALGNQQEAKSMISKVTDLDPDFNLETFSKSQPYKDQADLDFLVTQLQSVGLH